jgi:hypothetical protein
MKKQLLLTFALSVILTVFYTWYHAQAKGFITLSLQLSATTEIKRPILQIFFDTGQGFRERDSHSFPLAPQKTSQDLLYTIHSSVIYGLRLDYLNGPGSVLLQDMRFISTSGDDILSISIPEDSGVNQTSISHPTPGVVALTSTPTANDPYIIIPFSEPFLSPAGHFDLSQVQFGMKIFCALFVGISLIFMFTGNWFDRTQ